MVEIKIRVFEMNLAHKESPKFTKQHLPPTRYCLRCADTPVKLADYQQGLYALAVATMSNMSKSRTLALQVMTIINLSTF